MRAQPTPEPSKDDQSTTATPAAGTDDEDAADEGLQDCIVVASTATRSARPKPDPGNGERSAATPPVPVTDDKPFPRQCREQRGV